jgi:hypothetical protein
MRATATFFRDVPIIARSRVLEELSDLIRWSLQKLREARCISHMRERIDRLRVKKNCCPEIVIWTCMLFDISGSSRSGELAGSSGPGRSGRHLLNLDFRVPPQYHEWGEFVCDLPLPCTRPNMDAFSPYCYAPNGGQLSSETSHKLIYTRIDLIFRTHMQF